MGLQSLFTAQTPAVTDASDGTPGIATATSLQFTTAGQITHVRFYATATVSGNYVAFVYEVTANDNPGPGAGTLLQSKAFTSASVTAGTWNTVQLDTPVTVTPNTKLYRVGVWSGAGRYVATNSFFVTPLVNGNVVAEVNGGNPVGLGALRQGAFSISASLTYPASGTLGSSYFADVVFDDAPAGATVSPTGFSVPVSFGAPAVSFAGVSPSGLAVPVAFGSLTVVAGAPYAPAAQSGSWRELSAIRQQAAEEAKDDRQRRPIDCPNDGEPLEDVNGVLHCRYDGWIWRG